MLSSQVAEQDPLFGCRRRARLKHFLFDAATFGGR
jgi:hypothetical protein